MEDHKNKFDVVAGIAKQTRNMIEVAFPNGESKGACLHSSIALWAAITNFTNHKARIHGGGGGHGGMIGADCRMHPHYWLQVEIEGEVVVCDISADQFGHPSVIVASLSSPIGKLYYPSEQRETDIAASEMAASLGIKYSHPN